MHKILLAFSQEWKTAGVVRSAIFVRTSDRVRRGHCNMTCKYVCGAWIFFWTRNIVREEKWGATECEYFCSIYSYLYVYLYINCANRLDRQDENELWLIYVSWFCVGFAIIHNTCIGSACGQKINSLYFFNLFV